MTFERFKSQHEQLQWKWGQVDCSLALADWCMFLGMEDPALEIRGTYSTEEEMKSVVVANDGVPALVDRFAQASGLTKGRRKIGAVAAIGSRDNLHRQWGAIWDGSRWNVRLKDGFVLLSAPVLTEWNV